MNLSQPQSGMQQGADPVQPMQSGLSPSEIAAQLNISVESIIQHIRTRVGEGAIRFSEIYFSLPPAKRELVNEGDEEQARGTWDADRLQNGGLTLEDFEFYRSIRRRSVFAGDLYVHLSESELAMHDFVFGTLKEKFGNEEAGYWRKGVPLPIRQRCQSWREEDIYEPRQPFQYTTILDLSSIITKNWGIFDSIVPDEYKSRKKNLEGDLARLNSIRNTVMHRKMGLLRENSFQHDRADLTGKLARGFTIRDEFVLDEESLKNGLKSWLIDCGIPAREQT